MNGILNTANRIFGAMRKLRQIGKSSRRQMPGPIRRDCPLRTTEKVVYTAYTLQILDSYDNPTYPNGQAASVFKQHIPLVNAIRPPGEWQVYDIIFRAPRFEGKKLIEPAYITVLHNGVLVQNHVEILGTTEWIGEPQYEAHGCAPITLQDHDDLVNFRNIWVREL